MFLDECEYMILFRSQDFHAPQYSKDLFKIKKNKEKEKSGFICIDYLGSSSWRKHFTTENSKPPSLSCFLIAERIQSPQLQLQELIGLDHLILLSSSYCHWSLRNQFLPHAQAALHLVYHYVKWKWGPREAAGIAMAGGGMKGVKAFFFSALCITSAKPDLDLEWVLHSICFFSTVGQSGFVKYFREMQWGPAARVISLHI